jgi:dynein heavy chain 2
LQVAFEAPPGVKMSLQRTYEGWGEAHLAAGGPERAQLLFLLAWFHAVVQVGRPA